MMQNINARMGLYLLLLVSFLLFYATYHFQGAPNFNLKTIFQILPKIVSMDLILCTIFARFLWKFSIFKNWLVPFPNLNGTWKGQIRTTWRDPETGERPEAIPAILTIKQSSLKVSCVMRTAEMTSRSLVSDFVLDEQNQLARLIYTYDSNPIETVKERSPQHCGTMIFDIPKELEKNMLVGGYWTGRKTTGTIEMRFWKKELIDHYPEEMGPHPVSKVRGNKS